MALYRLTRIYKKRCFRSVSEKLRSGYNKGIRILAAAQADDVAIESGAVRHGLLTQALVLDDIEAGRADSQPVDGHIDLAEWLLYSVRRVPELYSEIRGGRTGEPAGARSASTLQGAQIKRLGERLAGRPPGQQPELFDFTSRRSSPLIANVEGTR